MTTRSNRAVRRRPMTMQERILRTRELTAAGWSAAAIGRELGVSERRTFDYRRMAAGLPVGEAFDIPAPVPLDTITDPAIRACLLDTPGGFRAFFNRYSPYQPGSKYPGMQDHALEFVRAAFAYPGLCSAKVDRLPCGESAAWGGHDLLCDAHAHDSGWRLRDGLEYVGRWKEQIVLNEPPRHIKSETWSIWFPIWRFVLNRSTRIILLSKTHGLAGDFSNYIANQLSANRQLLMDFGRMQPQADSEGIWRPGTGEIDILGRADLKERSLRSRGSLQQIYGMACDWLIADDVVDSSNSFTPEQRDKLENWFVQECLTRVEDGGHAVVLGTRFYTDDLYGRLVRKTHFDDEEDSDDPEALWEHITFPALRDPLTGAASTAPDAVPLWPQKWTRAKLLRKRSNLGSALFSATYQQDPVSPEDRWFQPEWFVGDASHEGCLDPDRDLGESPWPKNVCVRVIAVDPSPTQYAAAVIGDVKPKEDQFHFAVLDMERKKMDDRAVWELVERWADAYGPVKYLIVEKNSWSWLEKHPMWQWCRSRGIRPLKHHTGINKHSTDLGLSSLAGDFEFGRIRFPTAPGQARLKTEAFVEEAVQVPFGRHSDRVMSLWIVKPSWKELRTHDPRRPTKYSWPGSSDIVWSWGAASRPGAR